MRVSKFSEIWDGFLKLGFLVCLGLISLFSLANLFAKTNMGLYTRWVLLNIDNENGHRSLLQSKNQHQIWNNNIISTIIRFCLLDRRREEGEGRASIRSNRNHEKIRSKRNQHPIETATRAEIEEMQNKIWAMVAKLNLRFDDTACWSRWWWMVYMIEK